MTDRDCANCKHHTEDGCSSWDCEYKPKDLISRADAIEVIQNAYCKPCKERGDDYNEVRCRVCEYDNAIMQIDALPLVDRPQGEWTYLYGSIGSYMTISCPFCGNTFDNVAEWKYNYCPNCGARMKGGDIE